MRWLPALTWTTAYLNTLAGTYAIGQVLHISSPNFLAMLPTITGHLIKQWSEKRAKMAQWPTHRLACLKWIGLGTRGRSRGHAERLEGLAAILLARARTLRPRTR